MAKRNAASELNRDNWNDDDESEEAGTFTPASGSQLQNRVIKKAKRTLNSNSGNLQSGSPFAQFAGFASAATGSSPFSFLKKNSGDTGTNSPFSAAPIKVEEKANGNSTENPEKSTENLQNNSKASVSSTFESSSTTAPKDEGRNLEYYRQLQSLNQSVLKWMQLHLSKNSCCDFTPVFNDYKKHLDTLNVTYPVRKKDNPEKKNSDSFKNQSSTNDEFSKSKNSSQLSNSSVFQKANNVKQEDETDYGANFKSNTTNTSTFSFGIKSTPTATSSVSSSGPTSSSKEAAEEKKSTSEFSFGFNKTFQSSTDKPFTFAVTSSTAKPSESGENEEQEYVPPKNEFVAVTEEDALYSKRCKLFFKKGDGYAEKGVGTLYLKSIEGKTQLLIRADTSLGNILLNIMLSASLPMSRTGKNNVLLVCIPNPPLDAKNPDSKEAIPTLIRVKTSEDADELLETLNKHKS